MLPGSVRGSWLVARGSWLVARGSWLVARGSWLVARGSWLVASATHKPQKQRSDYVQLREFFNRDLVSLNLRGETKDEVLKELIGCLGLDEKSEGILFKMLKRRENLGSTGIGHGFAIPHCRSLVVNNLRVAFGRKSNGIDFKAIDNQPAHYFFMIVAPPLEVNNLYLPVLGKIAQFAKDPDVVDRLQHIQTPDEFLALLEEKSA